MQLDLKYFQPCPNEALQEIKLIHNYHPSQKNNFKFYEIVKKFS